MKKTLTAILLLSAVLLGAVLNYFYMKNICTQIRADTEQCRDAALAGDWEAAAASVQSAMDEWERRRIYASAVLHHADIADAADALIMLQEAVALKSPESAGTAARKVCACFDAIEQGETLALGNVF